MSTLSRDTSPEMENLQIDLLRQMPPWRKMQIVAGLNEMVRSLATQGLRRRYPEATREEIQRRLADILLGPALAAEVYGPLDAVSAPDRALQQKGETR